MNYDEFSGKTVLITGGAGAVGSNLTRTLSELGARVIVLDNLIAAEPWNLPSHPNLLFLEGDILDEVKLKRVFFERPQIVFHLAAFFANQNSVDHPENDLMTNGMGTLRLLEYSVLTGVERFVYASSGCSIYGSEAPLPLREDFVSMQLTTPYQITKMLGELYCNFFHHHYGLSIVRTRFFNSYGPGELPGQYRNVIPNFIYWALKGLPLPITGSGEETRDFTFVADLVDGLLRASLTDGVSGEALNLASGIETRIGDLAELINELTENGAGLRHVGRRTWDTKARICASIEKAQEMLGFAPREDFAEGVAKTVAWFKLHWRDIDAAAQFAPGVSSAVREMSRAPIADD